MTNKEAYIAIIIMALITFLIRALPFLIFNGKRRMSKVTEYLSKVLPNAIMAMLVIYCLKGINFSSPASFVPELIASAIVILLYVWKRNTLVSIIFGTVSYMIMVQFIFI